MASYSTQLCITWPMPGKKVVLCIYLAFIVCNECQIDRMNTSSWLSQALKFIKMSQNAQIKNPFFKPTELHFVFFTNEEGYNSILI